MTQERQPEHGPPETAEPTGDVTRASPPQAVPPIDVLPQASPSLEPHAPAALQSLRRAMRRARHDDAERMGAIADLRAARIGRLELLEEALAPLQAQIPQDVDLFDFGLMPGACPRLFIDMIGFVEMGRDAHIYRLVQDTRYGRRLLAESTAIPRMVDAVTDYVARRLLERDKALAADGEDDGGQDDDVEAARPAIPPPAARAAPRRRGRFLGVVGAGFGFLITLLGVITFCTGVFAILFYAALQLWPKLAELWPNLFGQA